MTRVEDETLLKHEIRNQTFYPSFTSNKSCPKCLEKLNVKRERGKRTKSVKSFIGEAVSMAPVQSVCQIDCKQNAFYNLWPTQACQNYNMSCINIL